MQGSPASCRGPWPLADELEASRTWKEEGGQAFPLQAASSDAEENAGFPEESHLLVMVSSKTQ